MFHRASLNVSLLARKVTVRRMGFMEDMIQKKMAEQAAKVMGNPEAMAKALAEFKNLANGPLGQNAKIKEMIANMGGVENIERMFSDPNFLSRTNEMMKNPDAVKAASEKVAAMLKDDKSPPASQ